MLQKVTYKLQVLDPRKRRSPSHSFCINQFFTTSSSATDIHSDSNENSRDI